MPTLDEVRDILAKAGRRVEDEWRLPDGHATQLRLPGAVVVNVYDTGRVVVQGKQKGAIEALLEVSGATIESSHTKVFVVYGHDPTARGDLENMLRRWGLEPIFLDQLPSQGQTIIEKLEKYRAQADFAVVLATPDDEGHRSGRPDEKAYRARQNVFSNWG